ncbi:hypothetical protein HPB49_000811 [Dermacentor silvarum]|uniref:Uncharacterized protein n=1 Tax=Dermacentor silvarum TaxID=543639 RepID=A0ACB8C6Q5_DERSI|nr:hypothetical protein HPB49_000811 [Dermacentor silvarum]
MVDRAACLIASFNLRSLLKHMDDVVHDVYVSRGDTLCLMETRMRPDDKRHITEYSFVCATKQPDNVATSVAIYAKPGLELRPIQLGDCFGADRDNLQMEMAEQNTRVQMLKEEALELLRQGPRYSKTVESELSALSERWNAVVEKLKAALEQAARVGQEVSSLQQQARSLEQERGVPSAATQALLQRLLQLWNQAQGQIAVLHSPEPSCRVADGTQTEQPLAVIVDSGAVTCIPDYVAKVAKVREALLAVGRQAHAPELCGKDFEDFEKQEGILKSVKEALDALKPTVDSVKQEQAAIMQKSNDKDALEVSRAVEKMSEDWTKLKQVYADRHSRWLKTREFWQQFDSSIRGLNLWMEEIETILVQCHLPNGDLDVELSQKHQESMEKQVTEKMPHFEDVKTMTKQIMEQCSAADGVLLQQKLDTLTRRWKSIISELQSRRERLAVDNSRTEQVKEDMLELKPWLMEVDRLLSYSPNEDDDIETTKERLEQLKKCEEEIGAKRSNLLSVILGGSLVRPAEVESLEARFQKASTALPQSRKTLESYIPQLTEFEEEIAAEQQRLSETRRDVEKLLAAKLLGDPSPEVKVAEDTLLRHGNTIQEICSKSKEVEKLLPLLPSTKNKLNHLKESWDAIRQIVSRIGPPLSLVIDFENISHPTSPTIIPLAGYTKQWNDLAGELEKWLKARENELEALKVDYGDEESVNSAIEYLKYLGDVAAAGDAAGDDASDDVATAGDAGDAARAL